MSKMRVVQVTRPKGPLELVEREIPEPAAGSVRIKVQACGICHSDSVTNLGTRHGQINRSTAALAGGKPEMLSLPSTRVA
jgi:D-arabinose 1-dehydrogenase-like Zn-dependent alcohol dehydrogenase